MEDRKIEDGRNKNEEKKTEGTTSTKPRSSNQTPTTARKRGRPPKILDLKGQPKIGTFLVQKSQPKSQAHCTTRLVGSTDERDSSLVQHSTSTIDADNHATLVGNKTTEVGKSMGNGAAHRNINGQL